MVSPQDDWKERGFSCGLFRDPPGQQWLDFVHGVDELFMVEKGKVRLTLGDDQFIAEQGEEYFIPAGVVHSVENVGNSESAWWYGYKER